MLRAFDDQESFGPADPVRFSGEPSDRFYLALRTRVQAFFEERGTSRYGNRWMWLKVAGYFALWVGTYLALVLGSVGAWTAFGLCVLFGVLSVLLAFNVGHDATHHALSDRSWVNSLFATLALSLPGGNAYLYALIHNTPHPFPNVSGIDVTMDQVGSILRLSPLARLQPHHRWQHIYAPLVYSLYSLFLVFVKDFKIFSRRQIGNLTITEHPLREKILIVVFKAVYVAYALAIPLLVLPFPWYGILGAFVVTHLFMGLLIAAVLQPVHLAIDLHFSQPDDRGRILEGWAQYQLEATKDFAPESRFANWLLGGLNTHTIHHLFPGICHIHYVELTRILRSTCAEFGVAYTSSSFARAVAAHFAFLRVMGVLPADGVLPPGQAVRLPAP